MKIVIFEPVAEGDIPHEPLTVDVGCREAVCHEVFCGIGIETPQGRFGIAQRDGGIEVLLNGDLVYSSTEPDLHPPGPLPPRGRGVLDALDRYARGKESQLFQCLGCGLLENYQGTCWRCGGNEWKKSGTVKSPEACMVDAVNHYARTRAPESPEDLEESPEALGKSPEASGGPRGKSGGPRGKSELFECVGCGLLHTSAEERCPRCASKDWRAFQ